MVSHGLRVTLAVLLLSSLPVSAQWAVFDGAASLQRASLWVEEAAQWAESFGNQVKEIEATYNVILHQIKQYDTMIQNLQRLPDNLNILDQVTLWTTTITGLLNKADIMSYDLGTVTAQFNSLYKQVGTIRNPGDLFALRQRLLAARMEASQMTVDVTAIRKSLTEVYARLCALLSGSVLVHGNLDIQQVQAQQNGLLNHTLQSVATIQATHARNTAQAEAEKAAIEQIQLEATQAAMGAAAPLGPPQGKLPKLHW